jgi:hypothetical protein
VLAVGERVVDDRDVGQYHRGKLVPVDDPLKLTHRGDDPAAARKTGPEP